MRSEAVDVLISSWSAPQQEVVHLLRNMILDASSAIIESVKFNIPFYDMNGMLMYISPQKGKDRGVVLAFCQGRLMDDPADIFTAHDRKEVRHIVIYNLDEKLLDTVQQYIYEAVAINKERRSFTKR
jgi:hypothetical protein